MDRHSALGQSRLMNGASLYLAYVESLKIAISVVETHGTARNWRSRPVLLSGDRRRFEAHLRGAELENALKREAEGI